MGTLLQDLRYGLRMLAKNPGFTAVAVITLALGIGATTAVFTVVDRDLFRSLPYPDADRLVSWGVVAPIEPQEFMLGKPYVELRGHQTPFEAFTSWTPGVIGCDLTEQNPIRLSCARVEANFLVTFGVHPLLGRDFTREDDRPNAPKVALLSYGLWQRRLGGRPDAVGGTLMLDGEPVRIIGVLPQDFEMPTLAHVDALVPQVLDEAAQLRSDTGRVLRTFARLKPGVTLQRATFELQPLFKDFIASAPPQFRKEIHLSVRSLRDFQVSDLRRALWVLLASVMAVLLIACANVASLMLARAASRRQERAIRVALGAGRGRLARQTLTECLLLGLFGGAAGCFLSKALLRLFIALAPSGIPRLHEARLDPRVLLFVLALSVGSAILFGLGPALQAPKEAWLTARRVTGFDRHQFRQALVVTQVAISLVLLAGASLLLRSLWNLENDSLGMQDRAVLAVTLDLGRAFYPQPGQRFAFFEEIEARLKRLPGIEALALSDSVPPGGWEHARIYAAIEVEGRPRFTKGTGGMVAWRSVTPGYFSVLDIPILRGRGFVEQDRTPDTHVIVLSQALARRIFPGQDPLGQHLRLGLAGPWFTVVGVAGDVKNAGLARQPDPEYYVVRRRAPEDMPASSTVLIRGSVVPEAMAQWVRSEIAGINPALPVSVDTMRQRVKSFAVRPRFNAALLGLFAAFGCLLAAVGIYGVISFLVTERTREIGVRMAIGATRGDILRLFAGKGLRLIAIGSTAGVLSGLAASRVLASLLFGVGPDDPFTFAAAVAALAGVTLAATYIPARRAMKVAPMEALRYE